MRRTLEKSSKNNQRFVGGREGKRPKRIWGKQTRPKYISAYQEKKIKEILIGCNVEFLFYIMLEVLKEKIQSS